MLIRSLELRNFRCFEHYQLSLAPRFNLLIGDNGSGKTAVLDALAVGLGSLFLGFPEAAVPRGIYRDEIRVRSMVQGQTYTREFQFPVAVRCEGSVEGQEGSWSRELNTRDGRTTRQHAAWIQRLGEDMSRRARQGTPVLLPVISYYGTGRLYLQKRETAVETLPPGARGLGYLDCLNPRSDEKRLFRWFKTNELAALQKQQRRNVLEAVRSAMIALLPGSEQPQSLARVPAQHALPPTRPQQVLPQTAPQAVLPKTPPQQVLPQTPPHQVLPQTPPHYRVPNTGAFWDLDLDELVVDVTIHGTPQRMPFHLLSDGYRNVIGMAGDIAYRMATLNPHLGQDALRQTPGVVLIDEVDLHLHPKWQRIVIGKLLDAFPKVQFVGTSHSPFIIQSLHGRPGCLLWDLAEKGPLAVESKSIEDIAETKQGVEIPQQSARFLAMKAAAEKYYAKLRQAQSAEDGELEQLRRELDETMMPFSDDPAYQAS